jgi:hypothetical protein
MRLIELANDILAREYPATVGQVFYCLIAINAIENSDPDYKRVSRILTIAHKDGRIPYEWIVDRSRPTYGPNVFKDPETCGKVVAKAYHRDYWTMQPTYIEVWSEKDAIIGSIEPVTDKYGVIVRVARGFKSTTRVREVAKALLYAGKKPKYIFYAGNHDPSERMAEVEVLQARPVALLRFDWPCRSCTYHACSYVESRRRLGHSYAPPGHPQERHRQIQSAIAASERHPQPCAVVRGAVRPRHCRTQRLAADRVRKRIERAICDFLDKEAWGRAMRMEKAEQDSIADIAKSFARAGVADR